jgi:hypothetical protein
MQRGRHPQPGLSLGVAWMLLSAVVSCGEAGAGASAGAAGQKGLANLATKRFVPDADAATEPKSSVPE